MAEQANVSLNTSDNTIDLTPRLHSFVIRTFVIGVIIVVGIIGNSLTFVVFWKGNFKSSTSFLFMSLSLIDSALLLISFPVTTVTAFVNYTGWLQGLSRISPYLTVYGYPLAKTVKMSTAWMTVLVAVNRYIIVCLPLRAWQLCTLSKVKIQLAVVLTLAVVCNIPRFVQFRVKYDATNNGTSYVDFAFQECRQFYITYDAIWCFVLWTGVPLFVLTLLTIRLINAMKAHRRMKLAMNRGRQQQDSNVTFALIIVVIVFIICHVPKLVLMIVLYVVPYKVLKLSDVWHFMRDIATMFIILNSAVNFFIYILANKRFRDVLTETICRRHVDTLVVTARPIASAEEPADDPPPELQ